MTLEQIQAVGNFLTYYNTDLNYIIEFQNFKRGKIQSSDFVKKNKGSFYSFLIEFRVVRNFTQGNVHRLLEETYDWINGNSPNDVDGFAESLSKTNLTRNGIMTSMASKILFLNNPWEIIPMDSLARKTLKQKENKYSIYKNHLNYFRQSNETAFLKCLNNTNSFSDIIENNYKESLENLSKIRENRILDKLLWTLGKEL